MATTRITNLWREDLTEPNPDLQVARVFAEVVGADIDLRVTRMYVEALHEVRVASVPVSSLVPIIITQNV